MPPRNILFRDVLPFVWTVYLIHGGFGFCSKVSVSSMGSSRELEPYSMDCLRPTIDGQYPPCDPSGIENICCFGLDCLPVPETKYEEISSLDRESKLKLKLQTNTVHKCINRFQAGQPGSPECLKVDKNGIFPVCDPRNKNGNCCIGLMCVENPAKKGDFRCANKIEMNFNPIGGDLSKPGGGYDPTKFIPNPSQYVPGPANDFVPHVKQTVKKAGVASLTSQYQPQTPSNFMLRKQKSKQHVVSHIVGDVSLTGSPACLIVGKTGFPPCDPKVRNGNCCIGLECIENPRKKGDFRCANKIESAFNPVGTDLSKPGAEQDPTDFVHAYVTKPKSVMLLRQDLLNAKGKRSYALVSLSLSLIIMGGSLMVAWVSGWRRSGYNSIK